MRALPTLTPDGHEDGEDDGGTVVEQVGDFGEGARVLQAPVRAVHVALRTHGRVAHLVLVAYLQAAKNRDGVKYYLVQ